MVALGICVVVFASGWSSSEIRAMSLRSTMVAGSVHVSVGTCGPLGLHSTKNGIVIFAVGLVNFVELLGIESKPVAQFVDLLESYCCCWVRIAIWTLGGQGSNHRTKDHQ